MKLDLQKFNPTEATLKKMANDATKLKVSDLHNTSEVQALSTVRKELGKTRRSIEEIGKALRADAVKFQKDVKEKERELVAIISPEEKRLKQIEDDSKELLIHEDREKLLPERCEKFRVAGLMVGDNDLLDMDDDEFTAFYNIKLSEKLDADRVEADEKKDREELERQAQAQKTSDEAEDKALKAQAKIDKANEKILEAQRQIEKDKREIEHQKELAETKVQAEKDEKERVRLQEIEDKKEQEEALREKKMAETKDKKYQAWLKKNAYNENTDKIKETDEFYLLYRQLDVLRK